MRRGTTPAITIQTDTDLTGYPTVVLTIRDKGTGSLDLNKTDLSITAEEITVTLTQAQTLAFTAGDLRFQLRAVDSGGNAIASNYMYARLDDVLKDGAIT